MTNFLSKFAFMQSPTTTVKELTPFDRVPWKQSKNSKKHWIDKQQDAVDKMGTQGSSLGSNTYYFFALGQVTNLSVLHLYHA